VTTHFPTGDVTELIYLPPNTNSEYYISPHTYTVRVKDASSGTFLPDAVVRLERTDIGYAKEIRTNASGTAVFTSLHSGDLTRTITLDTYTTKTDTYTIQRGANTETVLLTH
jgi:hypothetical protein